MSSVQLPTWGGFSGGICCCPNKEFIFRVFGPHPFNLRLANANAEMVSFHYLNNLSGSGNTYGGISVMTYIPDQYFQPLVNVDDFSYAVNGQASSLLTNFTAHRLALRKDLFPASAKKFQSAFNRINAVIDEQTFRGTQAEDFSYCFATPPHNDYVPAMVYFTPRYGDTKKVYSTTLNDLSTCEISSPPL